MQIQIEYWEIDICKVNKLDFLIEEVEEFTSRWSQNVVNIRSPSFKKPLNIVYKAQTDYTFSFSFGHGYVLLVWVKVYFYYHINLSWIYLFYI